MVSTPLPIIYPPSWQTWSCAHIQPRGFVSFWDSPFVPSINRGKGLKMQVQLVPCLGCRGSAGSGAECLPSPREQRGQGLQLAASSQIPRKWPSPVLMVRCLYSPLPALQLLHSWIDTDRLISPRINGARVYHLKDEAQAFCDRVSHFQWHCSLPHHHPFIQNNPLLLFLSLTARVSIYEK